MSASAEIVHNCFIFRNMEPKLRGLLADAAVVRKFEKGVRIFVQGDECPGLYVVGTGLVRLYKTAPSGKLHVLHFADSGKTFAEVAAFGGFNVPASADAAERTVCAMIPTHLLRALLREHHALCLQLLEGMSLWVRNLVGLIEDLVLRDASGRVAQHLLQIAPSDAGDYFALPMLRKDLASHLNLTSETLSRTLRRLAETDLIEVHSDQRLRISDPERLRAVAEGMPAGEFL